LTIAQKKCDLQTVISGANMTGWSRRWGPQKGACEQAARQPYDKNPRSSTRWDLDVPARSRKAQMIGVFPAMQLFRYDFKKQF
jgi:hypothetical protein